MSPSPPESGGPPTLLARRFELREVLGQGGTATVWRAFDREQGGLRAVKIVHPSLVGRKLRRRLTQEAELMARLQHPNVVRLIELGEDDDRLFLVMELVEGGSVADRTAEGRPLPPRMAVEVALGLLAALGYAHRHGVVHRDVKPHNVLLDLDGTPRVTDFGIARWEAAELTRTGAVLGTLAYMAPEQKASARAVDARSDLYAAGATLYAMLTGSDPHDLFAAGLDPRVAVEQLDGIPEALRPWILTATSFRPEDRFPDADRMATALIGVRDRLPADPPGLPLVIPREPIVLRPLTAATDSDEVAPSRDADPPSRVSPALERRRWSLPVGLAAIAALLAVGGASVLVAGSGVLWLALRPGTSPEGPSIAVAQPARAPVVDAVAEAAAEVAAPRADVPRAPRPRVEPEPAREAVAVEVAPPEPEPEPEPEVVPAAAEPAVVRGGASSGWDVLRLPNGRGEVELTATLRAERDVVDATGIAGRPRLVLRCARGRLQAMLDTGLEEVAVSDLGATTPFVPVEISAGEWTDRRQFGKNTATPGLLNLSADRKLVSRLLEAREVRFGYRSFAGASVSAEFRPADPGLQYDLDRECR